MAAAYRRDIDGMRGVAILLVVLHHAHIRGFEAGYLGVDMFFVISGYVITGIIAPSIAKGTFSFADFFARRVRRLFPALYAMLLVSTVFSLFLVNNLLFQQYIQTFFATNLFLSNVYLLIEAVESATPSAGLLLHTWSLGVEAQFYVCMPLLLMVCVPAFGVQRTVKYLLVVSALSLAGSFYLQSVGQWDAAFYLLPARMWELGIGSCLALSPKWSIRGRLDGQAVFGSLLFLFALWWGEDRFRLGLANVVMCVASLMMIASGIRHSKSGNWLTKLLESNLLVSLGLISYSLYLWHYPIFRFFDPNATWIGVVLGPGVSVWVPIVVSVIAAMLSWRLIEQPMRMRWVLGKTKHLFAFFACVFVLCFYGSLLLFSQIKDVPMGLDTGEGSMVSHCHLQEEGVTQCLWFDASAHRMLIIGDEYVSMYMPVLLALAKRYRVNLDVVTLRGCSLVAAQGFPWDGGYSKRCEKQRIQRWSVINRISQQHAYDGLLWTERPQLISQTVSMRKPLFERMQFLSEHFKHVWLVLPPPVLGQMMDGYNIQPVWRDRLLHAFFGFGELKDLSAIPLVVEKVKPTEVLSRRLEMHANQDLKGLFMEATKTFEPVRLLDPKTFLCSDGKVCSIKNKEGQLLYNIISRHALSYQGVLALRSMFEPVFEKLSKKALSSYNVLD